MRDDIIYTEAVIIGAGPSGLALGHLLRAAGVEFCILEQSETAASSWDRETWFGLTVAMPARDIHLPYLDLTKIFPADYHLKRDEIIQVLNHYAKGLPITFNTQVTSIKRVDGDFHITTNRQPYIARNVFLCIGPRKEPKIPSCAKNITATQFMHSTHYKLPAQFPDNARLLVVGSGLSATQIASELANSKKVTVAIASLADQHLMTRNPHHFFAPNSNVIRYLPSALEKRGIPNYGKLVDCDGRFLIFQLPGSKEKRIPVKDFTCVIFATGFIPSLERLHELLGETVTINKDGSTNIPGIYAIGITQDNQPVAISDASRVAETAMRHYLTTDPTRPLLCRL